MYSRGIIYLTWLVVTSDFTHQVSLSDTLSQNSAKIGYITEEALLISVHLSTDAVSLERFGY